MKKAIIIGGSNGIGLAIGLKLIELGYFLEICDKVRPEDGILKKDKYYFNYCDLNYFDEDLFINLCDDKDTEILMITAGIGRIADFQFHHISEIEKIFIIDTVSIIKIFRIFYERIMNSPSFYVGVMGSVAGLLCSPSASVYAAAKAALVRFVESVNIELEEYGSKNRILNVSPASFKGSKFYGKNNDISLMESLANEIIMNLFAKKTLFIPNFDEILRPVFEKYYNDPHEYGLYSYEFKKKSGRLDNNRNVKIGYLSGTFDLFHIGHLNILQRAKEKCDYLIVGVHSSGKRKGKETFIPLDERKKILSACKYVNKVVDACSEDSDAWDLWHYDKLFVGSDYKGSERFQRYEKYFQDKKVEIIYFPYTQTTSSSQIRKILLLNIEQES